MITRAIISTALLLGWACLAPAAEHLQVRSVADENVDRVLVAGATGRLGQPVTRELLGLGFQVRGLTRDSQTARAKFGTRIEWYEADVLAPESLAGALRNVDLVVNAAGATRPDGPNSPRFVDYEGVVNLIDAAVAARVRQFIFVSSIGVTQRFHLLNLTFGDVLTYKARSERYLRASGLRYSIVRPGGLRPGPGGLEGLLLEQGDKKGGSYVLIPDVASLIAWLVDNPAGDAKSFEVLSDPNAPPLAWRGIVETLETD